MSSKKKTPIRHYRCKLDYFIYQSGDEFELQMVALSGILINTIKCTTLQDAIDIVNKKIDFVFKGTK